MVQKYITQRVIDVCDRSVAFEGDEARASDHGNPWELLSDFAAVDTTYCILPNEERTTPSGGT